MTNYIYVGPGGIKSSGDSGTTPLTGLWSSLSPADYYPTFAAAYSATGTSGSPEDTYVLAETHDETIDYTLRIYGSNDVREPLSVFSVDVNAINVVKKGAQLKFSGSYFLYPYAHLIMRGIIYSTATSTIGILVRNKFTVRAYDCEFLVYSTAIKVSNVGTFSSLHGCRIVIANSGEPALYVGSGSGLEMYGGSVESGSLIGNGNDFTTGGGRLYCRGVDLTLTGPNRLLYFPNIDLKDAIDIELEGCYYAPGIAPVILINQPDILDLNQHIKLTRSNTESAGAEYQHHEIKYGGRIEDATNIYRDESEPFTQSNTKVSYKFTTSYVARPNSPLVFQQFPARYVKLSQAGQQAITLYFASLAVLTDADVWAVITYPDVTNTHVFKTITNEVDIALGGGTVTPHIDDSGGSTWKDGGADLVGYNEYKMVLDTSGAVGADAGILIDIFVSAADTVIYFDSSIGVS